MSTSWRNLSIWACVVRKYIFSMSERESKGVGWMVDLSSEPREESELRLLRLDIKEMSELSESPELESPALESPKLLSLVMGMMKGSMDISCRYLERRARLTE